MTGTPNSEARKEAGRLFRELVPKLGELKKLVKTIKLFGASKITVSLTITWKDGTKSNQVVDLLKPVEGANATPRS